MLLKLLSEIIHLHGFFLVSTKFQGKSLTRKTKILVSGKYVDVLAHLPLFFQGELELLRRVVLIFAQQLCNPRKSGRRSRTCMTSHILLVLRSTF